MTNKKNPAFEAISKNVDGVDMVHIKVGKEELWFTIEEAYGFTEYIENVAGQVEFEQHVDDVFDNWGTEGGTC